MSILKLYFLMNKGMTAVVTGQRRAMKPYRMCYEVTSQTLYIFDEGYIDGMKYIDLECHLFCFYPAGNPCLFLLSISTEF